MCHVVRLITLFLRRHELLSYRTTSVQLMIIQHDAVILHVATKENSTFITAEQLQQEEMFCKVFIDSSYLERCGHKLFIHTEPAHVIAAQWEEIHISVCVQLQNCSHCWWDIAQWRRMIGCLKKSRWGPAAHPALVFVAPLCCCCRVSHLSSCSAQPLLALCPLNMTWVLILHGDI